MPNSLKKQRSDLALVPMILAQMQSATKTKSGKIRLRRPPRPKSLKPLERRYFKQLLAMLELIYGTTRTEFEKSLDSILINAKVLRPSLDSITADEWPQEIAFVIRGIKEVFNRAYTDETFKGMAEDQANAINDQNLNDFRKTFKTVLGIDYYAFEPWVRFEVEAFTNVNVSYITSLSTDAFAKIEQIVVQGVTKGKLTRDIQKEIQEAFGVSERRAALIAVDQTNKFNAALNETRQKSVGIEGYFWRGVLDARERPEHRAREGEAFLWTAPPEDGHPGQPIRCRCYPEPIFDPALFK